MNHVGKYDNEYKDIMNYLYFYQDKYFVYTTFECNPNYRPNCNICNVHIHGNQHVYSSRDYTFKRFCIIMCGKCSYSICDINKRINLKNYYILLTLLSQELLTNYIPAGHIIPEISKLILKNIIDVNINNHVLDKYQI